MQSKPAASSQYLNACRRRAYDVRRVPGSRDHPPFLALNIRQALTWVLSFDLLNLTAALFHAAFRPASSLTCSPLRYFVPAKPALSLPQLLPVFHSTDCRLTMQQHKLD